MENEETTRVLFKIIYILKRLTDDWGETEICQVYNPDFKVTYIPAFMCIGTQGASNNEVAKQLKVSKMAASKIIKELVKLKLVRSETSVRDARSEILYLTNEGQALNRIITDKSNDAVNEYKKITGCNNYEQAIDVLLKITEYHEALKK